MLYNPPTGAVTANDAYIGKNVAAGIIGSKLPPKAAEAPQREIVNAELAAGLSPTNSDFTQLAQAMSIGLWLGAIGGSANALADVLPTLATTSDGVTQYAIPALVPGMTFHGIVPATNTGPAMLTLTGFGTAPGAKPIVRRDGTPIQGGDLPAGAIVSWRYDGIAYRVVGLLPSDVLALFAVRLRLMANLNVYVALNGSDTANTGLSPASPFATLQRAYNFVQQTYDFNGFTITINAAPGTYPAGVSCNAPVSGTGTVLFNGSTANPGSVFVNVTNASCFSAFAGANIAVQGFQVGATGTGLGQGCGLYAQGGNIITANMVFGNCAVDQMFAQIGSITIYGPINLTGNAQAAFNAQGYGTININSYAVTFGGGTYSVAVANATSGFISAGGTQISGTAGGKRFQVGQSGSIQTNGGGPKFFPGTSDGTIDSTSSYG